MNNKLSAGCIERGHQTSVRGLVEPDESLLTEAKHKYISTIDIKPHGIRFDLLGVQ